MNPILLLVLTLPQQAAEITLDNVPPVKLEAGKTYAIWLNTPKFKNFRDKKGRSAVPYLLVFRTAGK